ncbi:MAG TPA: bifunctional (p)ppGpp synthetase/guanosine-3',5'-bis(diphosphate) 3'-pyrophosphohydrolase, partial [Thermoflexia bacterium]|nr:bifunctional (p)ppGpp synthetase/guanosine-3',5'-bis(diphosphate) 3'-pyrophosphohydrolase [Thermoflexia bacterium]
SDVTLPQLREQFGDEVAELVAGVMRLEKIVERVTGAVDAPRELKDKELVSLRKLLASLTEDDDRIIIIELVERLHYMQTFLAPDFSPADRRRVARETMEVFAPLANRLGIWRLKSELEDLSFRYLQPEMYQKLAEMLDARKGEREARVAQHQALLREELAREGIAQPDIKGRPKHIYSIYRKMQRKDVPFEQIYDREGLRVIVDTKEQCYQTLAIAHRRWEPIPGEYDNYIVNKKPNGYQSLHTAVRGEDGKPLEIQIRTHEMHRIAEYGRAAHWRYKEADLAADEVAQTNRLRGEEAETPAPVSLPQVVYVVTPLGNLFEFPYGATPIDFAYRVHTKVGHTCRGAKVNGIWAPLDYVLQMGDEVEIITGRKGGPSRDWLNEKLGFVGSPRTRQKIRQWFRKQGREENIAQGRLLVERILKQLNIVQLTLAEVAALFTKHYQLPENFFNAVGMGDVTNARIENRVRELLASLPHAEPEEPEELIPERPELSKTTTRVNINSLRGKGDLLTQIAGCCNPLPGDQIIGYVTRGRGVTIHRRDCHNARRLESQEPERMLAVSWGESEELLMAQVVVKAYANTMRSISEVIDDDDQVSLYGMKKGRLDRNNILLLDITLKVTDLAALDALLVEIAKIPKVIFARRRTSG